MYLLLKGTDENWMTTGFTTVPYQLRTLNKYSTYTNRARVLNAFRLIPYSCGCTVTLRPTSWGL